MKIAVIGGGSTYTPELIEGFIERAAKLGLTELALMDIDPERLSVVGGFAQRMVAHAGDPFRVTLTKCSLSFTPLEKVGDQSYGLVELCNSYLWLSSHSPVGRF